MAQIELWTRFGRQLSSRRGARHLEAVLHQLPSGTAIEGDWLQVLGVFFVSDITFTGRVAKDWGLVNFHRPATPEDVDIEILNYPPDDWRMELFLNGDRVLALSQPDEQTTAIDLRSHGYEERIEILNDVMARIDHPDVRMLPAAEVDFRWAYEEWKAHDFAEGVVIKQRQSTYQSGHTSSWKRHLYEWD